MEDTLRGRTGENVPSPVGEVDRRGLGPAPTPSPLGVGLIAVKLATPRRAKSATPNPAVRRWNFHGRCHCHPCRLRLSPFTSTLQITPFCLHVHVQHFLLLLVLLLLSTLSIIPPPSLDCSAWSWLSVQRFLLFLLSLLSLFLSLLLSSLPVVVDVVHHSPSLSRLLRLVVLLFSALSVVAVAFDVLFLVVAVIVTLRCCWRRHTIPRPLQTAPLCCAGLYSGLSLVACYCFCCPCVVVVIITLRCCWRRSPFSLPPQTVPFGRVGVFISTFFAIIAFVVLFLSSVSLPSVDVDVVHHPPSRRRLLHVVLLVSSALPCLL